MLGFLNDFWFTYGDIVSVWQLVNDALVWVFAELFEGTLEIGSNIAHLLFRISRVKASSLFNVRKMNSLFFHEFHKVVREMLSSKIHFLDGVR